MLATRILCGTAVVLLPAALPAKVRSQSNDSSQVVAEVGNEKLTLPLQKQSGGRSFAERYALYQEQLQAVQALIDHVLLKQLAEKERISVTELLTRHVESNAQVPTDDRRLSNNKLMALMDGVFQWEPPDRGRIVEAFNQRSKEDAHYDYIASLRAGQKIRILLEPPKAEVALGAALVRGPSSASVLLIEFNDYQCPYCRQMEPTLQKLQAQYGDRLKVVVYGRRAP